MNSHVITTQEMWLAQAQSVQSQNIRPLLSFLSNKTLMLLCSSGHRRWKRICLWAKELKRFTGFAWCSRSVEMSTQWVQNRRKGLVLLALQISHDAHVGSGPRRWVSLWMMILKLFVQGQQINVTTEKPDAVLNWRHRWITHAETQSTTGTVAEIAVVTRHYLLTLILHFTTYLTSKQTLSGLKNNGSAF